MYEVEILTLHTGKRVWYKNLGGRESKSDDKNDDFIENGDDGNKTSL